MYIYIYMYIYICIYIDTCIYLIPFNFRPPLILGQGWTKIKGVQKFHHFGWTKIKGSEIFSKPL